VNEDIDKLEWMCYTVTQVCQCPHILADHVAEYMYIYRHISPEHVLGKIMSYQSPGLGSHKRRLLNIATTGRHIVCAQSLCGAIYQG
jgi:hypothetical protein